MCYGTFLRFSVLAVLMALVDGCGKKKPFDRGEELSPAVLGGSGGSRTQTTQTTSTKTGTNKTLYNIVNVTQIVEATSGIAEWNVADLPFTGPVVAIGQSVLDTQTPFQFAYSYPQNNYQFVEAHLVIETSKDTSDTEAIFVDGVLSGRPPAGAVNTASPHITDKVYFGSGAATLNTYYIDWSLGHYQPNTRNSFDLNVSDLLAATTKTAIETLSDGKLNVATADDSPIFQAYLVIRGRTISSSSLSCVTSNTYTFKNDYLHNDGNTLGQNAVTGNVQSAYTTWNVAGTYDGTQFYYDSVLPKVETENTTITSAKLAMTAKRQATGKAAVIINGVGISQTGFDRSVATDAVESWEDAATPAFDTFMTGVLTTNSTVSLDLVTLLGAERVRELLAQGKLNITLAGNLYASATNKPTTDRAVGVQVSGPRLQIEGTYFTEVCTVPNDPTSPLTQDGLVETNEEEVDDETVVTNDGAGPEMTSVQAVEITSTKATIIWMTDEPSTSQVRYGVGSLTSETPEDTKRTTYHQVELTGLSPYKYYNFQVVSKDKFGNETMSEIDVFVTLR